MMTRISPGVARVLRDRQQQQAEVERILVDAERKAGAMGDALADLLRRIKEAYPEARDAGK